MSIIKLNSAQPKRSFKLTISKSGAKIRKIIELRKSMEIFCKKYRMASDLTDDDHKHNHGVKLRKCQKKKYLRHAPSHSNIRVYSMGGSLRKYVRVLPDIYQSGHLLPSLTAFPVLHRYISSYASIAAISLCKTDKISFYLAKNARTLAHVQFL